jgi:PIN domain nuclease of toxin-antitoxin system
VTVFDASALLAALLDEPGRPEVERLLRSAEDPSIISAVTIAEVIDGLVRVGRRQARRVDDALDWLIAGGLIVAPVTESMGRLAGSIRASHYDRTRNPLSLADCVALATAASLDQALATSDGPQAATALSIGLKLVALPDSRGVRPSAA